MFQGKPVSKLSSDIEEFIKSHKRPVIVLLGPTASGKSSWGLHLAKSFNGEVIGGDSRQCYQGMTIGTGKTLPEEMNGIPHFLVDSFAPDVPFTAYDFKEQASQICEEILERKHVPFIVGGTGMYLNTLVYDYDLDGGDRDPAYRESLERELEELGAEALWKKLQAVDPESAESIHPNNARFVIRAMEVFHSTGKPKSARGRQHSEDFDFYLAGLLVDRETLYDKINARHAHMFEEGLVEEVKSLLEQYPRDLKAFDTIGYQEVIEFLDGKISLEECQDKVQQHARNYAKRQMTWFKKMDGVVWYES